jgi:SAM-dependent methyltransferase
MWNLMYGMIKTQVLNVAASLGLADILAEEAKDASALAQATGTHAESLARVLRCLVACGVLIRDSEDRYSLTSAGKLLRSDSQPGGRAGAIFYGSHFIWDAWGNLLENVRTGKTAFELAHGAPVFDYLSTHPDDLRINTEFMTEMALPRLLAAARSYAFPPSGLVVDVGGGDGAMLVAILEANPGLQGLLFELPEVVEAARSRLESARFDDRYTLKAGSFFDDVPAGGDVYVLSNILHDWDDDHCRRILANCRRAMREGARLFIVDAIMPNDPPFTLAALDLQMMVVLGGKQRTEQEYRAIIQPAGFQITTVVPSGMEAVAV